MSMPSPLVVAMDFDDAAPCLSLARQLDPRLCRLKVGKELFTIAGPQFVEQLQLKGFDVFLDLKFHDIPNTVAGAVRAASALGVWMVNVHAGGGPAMLEAARNAIDRSNSPHPTKLIAVTVLTSLDDEQLTAVGVQDDCETQVKRLAALSHQYKLDGVVCSPLEVPLVKAATDQQFLTVTPGVRLSDNSVSTDDQHRVMTPERAKKTGSDFLVIGRPITQADNPIAALTTILDALNTVA
ncbi:MAG: orotidine-5'-phosphate decarboxylase [Gammaproteobacteria bacterium]|nr:orotidine-5'-phosphate decarboxylase [Gammaproteobacteria bacterium]